MFTIIEIRGKEYKLKLRTVDIVRLEKKLGHSLMDMFMGMQDDRIPQLGELLAIVHASMAAYNHGITENAFYDLYDAYVDEGHSMFDLIPIVLELMQNSGIIPKDEVIDADFAEVKPEEEPVE